MKMGPKKATRGVNGSIQDSVKILRGAGLFLTMSGMNLTEEDHTLAS